MVLQSFEVQTEVFFTQVPHFITLEYDESQACGVAKFCFAACTHRPGGHFSLV